jgi:hypothetical protein
MRSPKIFIENWFVWHLVAAKYLHAVPIKNYMFELELHILGTRNQINRY